jgi:hypothetical protein
MTAAVCAPLLMMSLVQACTPSLPDVESRAWSHGKFSHFTDDERRQMAGRCEHRWRLPPYDDAHLPHFVDDAERGRYLAALEKERAQHLDALRALHPEATSLRALEDAGRVDPRTRTTWLDEDMEAGGRFELALAKVVGADRARVLVEGGGTKHTLTGCDPESGLYRSER